MNRRKFVLSGAALALASRSSLKGATAPRQHQLPASDHHYKKVMSYVEQTPVPQYQWASERAYEAFRDMKFGVRVHWGLYSIRGLPGESWSLLKLSNEERQKYYDLYKTWNPQGFDADAWVSLFQESGARMFSFTTKHHEGFSLYDTRTRIKSRVNWTARGGPRIEACDLAYSITETPFRRDVVKELCGAANKRNMKIDLYYSHPDWYDADFRPYAYHPMQTPSSIAMKVDDVTMNDGRNYTLGPEPTQAEVKRMMARHREQLSELLTNYGRIDMVCLDQWLGPAVWPELRETMLHLRKLQPDVMFRARGIGNYGDYYTPEGFVPGAKENSDVPWFVIYSLGNSFSYVKENPAYRGPRWIVHNLVDSVAKGGNFMVGIGPDGSGRFDAEAQHQLRAAGKWLQVNGEGIYATRPREGTLWKEGEAVRYTRTKNGSVVYAVAMDWPGKALTLTTVKPRPGSSVYLLGYPEPLRWTHDSATGATISLPENLQDESHRPCEFAWTFKIEV